MSLRGQILTLEAPGGGRTNGQTDGWTDGHYGESRTVKITRSCLSISHLVDIRMLNAIRNAQHTVPTGTFVLMTGWGGG